MTTWNYRVLARTLMSPAGEAFPLFHEIIECYYDDDGTIIAYTEALPASGDSLEELVEDLKMMLEATEPANAVLTPDDLPDDAVTPPTP